MAGSPQVSSHALEVLDFASIRESLSQRCETSPGVRMALELEPSFAPDRVVELLEQTEEALHFLDRQGISFRGVGDLAQTLDYIQKGGVADGASLFKVGELLRVSRESKKLLDTSRELRPRLSAMASGLTPDSKVEQRLADSLESDGTVRSDASPALASARERVHRIGQRVTERINSYLTGKTRELLSDPVVTQRSGRWVIPLKSENKGKIKGIIHDTSGSGGTVYLEPEDVVRLSNDLREAEAAERSEVERVLRKLSEISAVIAEPLLVNLSILSTLDLIFAKARYGIAMDGACPERLKGPVLKIKDGRHPLLDRQSAVPLTLELGESGDAILITGPNTGGKTVAIKTVGLFVAMAQAGLMLPARHVQIGCFSQIWADIGDEQSLQQSLSTFSAHIKNISHSLKWLSKGALVLLDEVGAGTDPAEGAALARALLLEFQKKGAKILASTHYGELKVFASNSPGFVNASMEFDVKSLRPTYRLLMGIPGSSHALHIAKRYGVPDSVLEEAARQGAVADEDVAAMIQKLERTQKAFQAAQSSADKLAAELNRTKREAEKKLAQAEEARISVRTRAAQELEDLLRQIRLEAAEVFEEVKKDPTGRGLERARQKLKELNDVGGEFISEMKPKAEKGPKADPATLIKGAKVIVEGLGQTGTIVEDPKGGKAVVQVGAMKMTASLDKLRLAPGSKEAKPAPVKRQPVTLEKSSTAKFEINLIQQRADDAQQALESFLDDALLGRLPFVRIVHGKGEGILRKVVKEVLSRTPGVQSVREAQPHEGGAGVTIASFQ